MSNITASDVNKLRKIEFALSALVKILSPFTNDSEKILCSISFFLATSRSRIISRNLSGVRSSDKGSEADLVVLS